MREDAVASGIWTADLRSGETTPLEDEPAPRFFEGRFAQLGNRIVWTALDRDRGELWITDGSTAGTQRLLAIEGARLRLPTTSNREVFVEQIGGEYELGYVWATDGTPEGTRRLAPGRYGRSHYLPLPGSYPLATASGRTFFAGLLGGKPTLYVTSGTRRRAMPLASFP